MGITLTGKITLDGRMGMGIDQTDPYAADVVFLATFETNFNNQINNSAPWDQIGVTRTANTGYANSYSAVFSSSPYSHLIYSPVDNAVISRAVPFTLEMWVNASVGGNLFSNTNFVTLGTVGINLSTNRLTSNTGGGGGPFCDYSMSLNQWHHVAVTRAANADTMSLFLDGVYKGSVGGSTWPDPGSPRWQFGDLGNGGWSAACRMDNIRITKAVRYPGTATFTPPTQF